MKLTEKDKEFLQRLKQLLESNDLWVELKPGQPSYMVLRGTYGQKVHETFRMSRQGVRWRFWHLFNQIYVESFEVVCSIERIFGSQLRDHAIRISRERYQLHQESLVDGFQSADSVVSRRESATQYPGGNPPPIDKHSTLRNPPEEP